MDSLPAELLLQIFTLACTDGSFTACSLARVSRFLYGISQSVRFHSVAMNGSPTRMCKFLAWLRKEREDITGAIPHIQHLFLASFDQDTILTLGHIETSQSTLLMTESQTADNGPVVIEREDDDAAWEQYSCLVHVFLSTVAPDLKTLTIVLSRINPSSQFPFLLTFPELTELTVVSGYCFLRSWTSLDEPHVLYPALTRLHCVCPPDDRLVEFAKCVLRITHLRMSHCPKELVHSWKAFTTIYSAGLLVPPTMKPDFTLTLVSITTPLTGNPDSIHPFPDIQEVLVWPAPPPTELHCGMSILFYLDFIFCLWRSQACAWVPMYLIPPSYHPVHPHGNTGWRGDEYPVQNACREWVERMMGRPGCWAVKMEWAKPGNHKELLVAPPYYMLPFMSLSERAELLKELDINIL